MQGVDTIITIGNDLVDGGRTFQMQGVDTTVPSVVIEIPSRRTFQIKIMNKDLKYGIWTVIIGVIIVLLTVLTYF